MPWGIINVVILKEFSLFCSPQSLKAWRVEVVAEMFQEGSIGLVQDAVTGTLAVPPRLSHLLSSLTPAVLSDGPRTAWESPSGPLLCPLMCLPLCTSAWISLAPVGPCSGEGFHSPSFPHMSIVTCFFPLRRCFLQCFSFCNWCELKLSLGSKIVFTSSIWIDFY